MAGPGQKHEAKVAAPPDAYRSLAYRLEVPSTLDLEQARSAAELARLEDRSAFGEVFTRRWIVDTLLDMVGYTVDADLAGLTVVDPSVGSGAFLTVAVERLLVARRRVGATYGDLGGCVRAFDVQSEHVAHCRRVVEQILVEDGCSATEAAELAMMWVVRADYLLTSVPVRRPMS